MDAQRVTSCPVTLRIVLGMNTATNEPIDSENEHPKTYPSTEHDFDCISPCELTMLIDIDSFA